MNSAMNSLSNTELFEFCLINIYKQNIHIKTFANDLMVFECVLSKKLKHLTETNHSEIKIPDIDILQKEKSLYKRNFSGSQ